MFQFYIHQRRSPLACTACVFTSRYVLLSLFNGRDDEIINNNNENRSARSGRGDCRYISKTYIKTTPQSRDLIFNERIPCYEVQPYRINIFFPANMLKIHRTVNLCLHFIRKSSHIFLIIYLYNIHQCT